MQKNRIISLAAAVVACACTTVAQAAHVTAQLVQPVIQMGDAGQLNLTVDSANGVQVPQTISANGLTISLQGRSTQVQMTNFKITASTVYSYVIVPQAGGNYVIPSFNVQIGDQVFHTSPLKLSVQGGGGAQASQPGGMPVPQQPAPQQQPATANQQQDPANIDVSKLAFGEMVIPRKTAYVGEVVPAELRFYFASGYQIQVSDKPDFGGEGFTTHDLSKPVQRHQTINGREYEMISFQTLLTPVKSGTLEIPKATLNARVAVPTNPPGGGGSDSFMGSFFGSGMFSETKDISVDTKPQELQVVTVPREGRPADFSGAIGQFTIASDASPTKTDAGDPVTLKVTVSGQGNFDAVSAPDLTNDDGWRSYPPSDSFQASDALGYSGDKTFNFTLIAKEDKTSTPGVSFSYFDPAGKKYVTITAAPVDVRAKGSGPAPGQTTTVASTQSSASATPLVSGPTARVATAELSGDFTPRKFEPLIIRRGYLTSNGVALGAWLALVGFLMVRNYHSSDAAHQSLLARDRRRLLDRLDDAKLETAPFYQTSVEFLAARLGLGGSVDTDAILARVSASRIPDELKLEISGILERHAELHYSARGGRTPGAEERQRVIQTLKNFDKAI